MVLAIDGKVFTLDASKLPAGAGGEPIRLLAEIDDGEDVERVRASAQGKRSAASSEGRGFVATENDMIANTRKGKMRHVEAPREGALHRRRGRHGGDRREFGNRLLCFCCRDPQMTRGKGVRLQRYKDGGLSDIKTFALDAGPSWTDSRALTMWRRTR